MKEPMTDARRKQLYRIKKRKRRKQCIRVALRMAVLCFLVLFAVQKTADLLRVDDSDRMEDAEQSYSGQGGKTRTNTEKTWGVFGKADVLTQEDKLHSLKSAYDLISGEACCKSKGCTLNSQIHKNCRYVNSLASRQKHLRAGTIGKSKPEVLYRHNIIQ